MTGAALKTLTSQPCTARALRQPNQVAASNPIPKSAQGTNETAFCALNAVSSITVGEVVENVQVGLVQ